MKWSKIRKAMLKGTADSNKEIEEARFADEGAADPSNNLRVVTEEELKNNGNKKS